jgi:hypothetical protein
MRVFDEMMEKMGLWLQLFGKVRFVKISLFLVTFPFQLGISIVASTSLSTPKRILSYQPSY